MANLPRNIEQLFSRVKTTLSTMSEFYNGRASNPAYAGYARQIDARVVKFDAWVAAIERRAARDGGHIPPRVEAEITASCGEFLAFIDGLVAAANQRAGA